MMHLCRKLLEHAGLNPDRLRIEWISAAEGTRFAEVMNDFTDTLRALGPIGKGEGLDEGKLATDLESMAKLIPYIKLVKHDKMRRRLEKQEDYDDLYTTEEVAEMFRDVVSYHIDPEKCQACMICGRHCPVDGIAGGKNQIHVINQDECIHCGSCYAACPGKFDAIQKIVGGPVPPPIPEDRRTVVRKGKKAPSA
jgi:ferredoxin